MAEPVDVQTDWKRVTELISEQPVQVRELVRYFLVMSLVDAGKARIRRACIKNRRIYLEIERSAGEVFCVLRPPILMATELRLREEIKKVLREERDG